MSLREDLIRDEGMRLRPYKDSVGILTIGVGRNLDQVGITEDEATTLLANDIAKVEADLDRTESWWRTKPEPVQRGLANMAFNLGISRLGGFKKMLACLQAGDYGGAATHALDSEWAKQVGDRATRIAELFRGAS